MKTLNNYNINLLDLPNEILFIIFNKLNIVDIFYSLVYVNKRFNQLILDPFYIQNLDLTVKCSLFKQISSLYTQDIGTICKKILPKIHHHIYKLTIPSDLIEFIINIDFPNLQSLSLVNFEEQKVLEDFSKKTIIYRLLRNQIKHFNIDIAYNDNKSVIFLLILFFGKHLTDLTFHNQFLPEHLKNSIFFVSSIHTSSTLTKLIINVTSFDDCLYLLDGSLQSLTILIIDIIKISESSSLIDNTKKLPKLKQFSLTSNCLTFAYNEKVVPLLCRMINIEDLTLFLHVGRISSPYILDHMDNYINAYIDGAHLYNDVLSFMPQLHKFTFSINTFVLINNIGLRSNDDIQRSFIQRGNQHVGSYVCNRLDLQAGRCHIFSLPYQFDSYHLMMCNFESNVIFDKVRLMKMVNTYPYEHELFKKISQYFPFLRKLTMINDAAQDDKENWPTFITFPYLEHLNIMFAHTDYAEKFLFQKNTHLPRLLELHIRYNTLTIITKNFTNDLARVNCSKIRHLVTNELFVSPKNFHLYFPLLKL